MTDTQITGQRKCAVFGTGQIGTYAIRALVEAGWTVIAADSAPALSFVRRFGRFDGSIFTVDVTNPSDVNELLDNAGQVDAVIFTAGLTGQKAMSDPALAARVAVEGVRNVASAMVTHGVPRLVAISSLAVYDIPERGDKPIAESASSNGPTSPYGQIVRTMERALGECEDLSIAILRSAGVFGPNRFGHGSNSSQLVERLLYSAAQGLQIKMSGDWSDCDDMIYARDVGRALAQAAALTDPGCEIINVGTSKTTTLRDLVRAVETVAGPADIVLNERPGETRPMTRPPLDVGRMTERLGAARYDLPSAISDFARETDLLSRPRG